MNVAPFVKPGDNEIAIVVSNQSGAGGLLKAVRLKQEFEVIKKINWEVSADLGGICQGWNREPDSTEGWSVAELPADYPLVCKGRITETLEAGVGRDALLTWYRLVCAMPRSDPSVRMPWTHLGSGSATGVLSSGVLATSL